MMQQQCTAADRRRADNGTFRQISKAGITAKKRITPIFTWQNRGNFGPGRKMRLHILHRMNRSVRLTGENGFFQFLDEQPFAPGIRE